MNTVNTGKNSVLSVGKHKWSFDFVAVFLYLSAFNMCLEIDFIFFFLKYI